MKDIVTYKDKYGNTDKYYKLNEKSYYSYYELINKSFYKLYNENESEEDKIARLAREKAIERDRKIDMILDGTC